MRMLLAASGSVIRATPVCDGSHTNCTCAGTLRVITLSVNKQEQGLTPECGESNEASRRDTMGTTTSIESQRALAWIVRQLKWERTLEVLRTQGTAATEERVAA